MRFAAPFVIVTVGSVLVTLFLSPMVSYAAGGPATGKHEFTVCARCHSISRGVNKRGPALARIVARKNGAVGSHRHSAAIATANVAWHDATLDKFPAGAERPRIPRTSSSSGRGGPF
jgi:cytochrome c2